MKKVKEVSSEVRIGWAWRMVKRVTVGTAEDNTHTWEESMTSRYQCEQWNPQQKCFVLLV